MTIVTVKDLFDGSYQVRLRGGVDFESIIESLKAVVPVFARKYDPDLRCWKIYEKFYLNELIEALEFFSDIKIEWASAKREYQRPRQTWRDRRAEAFKALHLRESAPVELIAAAKKVLNSKYHPVLTVGTLGPNTPLSALHQGGKPLQ
jgi:hypothetical protein